MAPGREGVGESVGDLPGGGAGLGDKNSPVSVVVGWE